MKSDVICSMIDDWTFMFMRNNKRIVVTIDNGIICVLNPNVNVDGSPLIIRAECGNADKFSEIILNILRGYYDDYYIEDSGIHMCSAVVTPGNEYIRDVYIKTAKKARDKYVSLNRAGISVSMAAKAMGI